MTEQLVTTAQPSTGLTVLPIDYPSYTLMIMTKDTAAGGLLRIKIDMDFSAIFMHRASRSTRFLGVSERVTRQSLPHIRTPYKPTDVAATETYQ